MMRTHTIVGHILGTNVDIYTSAFVTYDTLKNKLVTLLEQWEPSHKTGLFPFWSHSPPIHELLQRIPSYT